MSALGRSTDSMSMPPGPGVTVAAAEPTFAEVYRISVARYHEMIEAGWLTEDDPVELLEERLVFKMPKNPEHVISTRLLLAALMGLTPDGYFVDAQEPMSMEDSEPEPDFKLVRGSLHEVGKPTPEQVPLVIEVAYSSLARDRSLKKRVYARAGVPVYWIVNLIDRVIEVYESPDAGLAEPTYRQMHTYTQGQDVPVVLDGRAVGQVAVSAVMPPKKSA